MGVVWREYERRQVVKEESEYGRRERTRGRVQEKRESTGQIGFITMLVVYLTHGCLFGMTQHDRVIYGQINRIIPKQL